MTYLDAQSAAGNAAETPARMHFAERCGTRTGSLLLGALMIAIPAFAALPAAAREPVQQTQERQSDRGSRATSSTPPAREATPPARQSTPPARQASPPARQSTPPARQASPPARQSTPPARQASPPARQAPPVRSSAGTPGRSSEPPRAVRVQDRTEPRVQTPVRTDRPNDSHSDGWRVRTWPGRGDHDRRDDHRDRFDRRDRDRHSAHPRNFHRHNRYCGHSWGGYYGWGHYGYRGYSPWYWPWWPSIYVTTERYSAKDGWGALDLDVSPERAEVYLDGQYIGIADQYDGFPSYLWLEKGTYDLAIYLDGYETLFRQVTIYPGIVIDVNDKMRLGRSIHPDDYGPSSTERRDARIERNFEKEEAARATEATAEDVWSASDPASQVGTRVGRLYISVLPPDAAVYLDGHFLGTSGELGQLSAGLVVEPGSHVLELVRPGYETHRTEIVVPPGERTTVELELDRD